MDEAYLKKTCEKLATYYLSHGIMIRLHDIIEGDSVLEYLPLSDVMRGSISEVDSSIMLYSSENASSRFQLGESECGLGIVDNDKNRFYPLDFWDDDCLKFAEKFAKLSKKKDMTADEQILIAMMDMAFPILEWASETGHQMFKSEMQYRKMIDIL